VVSRRTTECQVSATKAIRSSAPLARSFKSMTRNGASESVIVTRLLPLALTFLPTLVLIKLRKPSTRQSLCSGQSFRMVPVGQNGCRQPKQQASRTSSIMSKMPDPGTKCAEGARKYATASQGSRSEYITMAISWMFLCSITQNMCHWLGAQ
jgi:hypothetical protein